MSIETSKINWWVDWDLDIWTEVSGEMSWIANSVSNTLWDYYSDILEWLAQKRKTIV